MKAASIEVALPGKNAPPPIPTTTDLLIAWLNHHYGYRIPAGTHFHRRQSEPRPGVVGILQLRYGRPIPAKDEDKGLFPSDAWNFVLTEEKRIAGGQKHLFPESAEAAS